MPLPTGAIAMSQVNTELGQPSSTSISLNQNSVRSLAQVSSGPISMADLHGKSSEFAISFAGGVNVNLRDVALANGWDGTSKLKITNTGTIYSNSTGTPALTISGSFPNSVTFTNTSNIIGCGGAQTANSSGAGIQGNAGGDAILCSTAVSINNTGTIGGGGGSGGSGAAVDGNLWAGGGGAGGNYANFSGSKGVKNPAGNQDGGPGGAPGQPGQTGVNGGSMGFGGGGGGGGIGAQGGVGGNGQKGAGGNGGAGGACVRGSSFVNWLSFGTRYGAIN